MFKQKPAACWLFLFSNNDSSLFYTRKGICCIMLFMGGAFCAAGTGETNMAATYEEITAALRDALAALEKASPAKASDWPAHESAEKNARELLARAA